ncbi:tetratricopeptide repeat protein [Undibacterium sp. JH2W]|uniref:tetratricopeptide repeat protein n=1 Tax=Undibacterium sp. JH2W TaxID=3413037 RepID=UPI003BEFB122
MRISDDPNYTAHMTFLLAKDFVSARNALELVLPTTDGSTPHKAYILQQIGLTYFYEDNVEEALKYYELAESVDPNSLSIRYATATFFAKKMRDAEKTIFKCEEIIRLAKIAPFEESVEDMSSQYYIEKAEELKRTIQSEPTE